MFSISRLLPRLALSVPLSSSCVLPSKNYTRVHSLLSRDVMFIHQTRFKSKSKSKPHEKIITVDQIPEALLADLHFDSLQSEYQTTLLRFREFLVTKMALSMTPEMIANITVPEAKKKLSSISQMKLKTADSSSGVFTGEDPILVVEIAGNPGIAAAAHKAVVNFLSGGKKSGSSAEGAASLVEKLSVNSFSVRLKSVVTQDDREKLVKQGRLMLNQIKHDMDKAYRKCDSGTKSLPKSHSADSVFNARQFLRNYVKNAHEEAEQLLKSREAELLNNK